MSLFESASLVVTPNGTKASKLYSVKPTDGSGDMTVVRATTATRVNSSGLIESSAVNVPRLDYTGSTCPSILVEPQRTNVLTYSEQFGTSWVNNGATIISNATTAPDGNLTADTLTATGGAFGVVKFSTWTATNKVASCFVKANTSNLFRIANVSGGGGSVTFNLSTQAITATTGFTGSIEALPNGWFRCVAIDTLARSGTFSIGVTAIAESVFVWGAQLESGSYSTSYIPTTTASVTRNADVISKTGISSLIGQTEGTLFLDLFASAQNSDSSPGFSVLSEIGTSENRIQIYTNNGFLGFIIYNPSALVIASAFNITPNTNIKVALGYSSGATFMFVNGTQVATTSAALSLSGLDAFTLNKVYVSDFTAKNNFKTVAIWKTKLPNSELATLTTL